MANFVFCCQKLPFHAAAFQCMSVYLPNEVPKKMGQSDTVSINYHTIDDNFRYESPTLAA